MYKIALQAFHTWMSMFSVTAKHKSTSFKGVLPDFWLNSFTAVFIQQTLYTFLVYRTDWSYWL